MKILAISDAVDRLVYDSHVKQRFGGVNFVLGCGDLPYYYLDYIVSTLNVDVYFVRGNHDKSYRETNEGPVAEGTEAAPGGCIDIHQQVVWHKGLILAGLEGSRRYNLQRHFQYTENEMWWLVASLIPRFMWNEWRHQRAVDIVITHAPPFGIHDGTDLPHIGFRSFNWLIKRFQPRLFIHGHKHVYRSDEQVKTQIGKTLVVNAYEHQVLTLD